MTYLRKVKKNNFTEKIFKIFSLQEEDTVEGEAALVRPIPAISHHSIMYAPKCLVLVSRLDYIETFRVS